MLRDRGSKKWTSLMLPEHVEALKRWDDERQLEKPPGERMDWELEELQMVIERAYRHQHIVSITVYRDKQWGVMTGWIRQINWNQNVLLFECDKRIQSIYFHTIQGAELDD